MKIRIQNLGRLTLSDVGKLIEARSGKKVIIVHTDPQHLEIEKGTDEDIRRLFASAIKAEKIPEPQQ